MKKIVILLVFILISSFCYADDCDYDFDDLFRNHGTIRLIIDVDTGSIEYVNVAAVDFYGYSEEQLLSMTIQEINTLSPAQVQAERKAAFEEHRNYFIFEHQLATGDIKTVEVHSYPIEHDERNLLFSVVIDITEKVKLEASLERSRLKNIYLSWGIVVLLILTVVFTSISKEKYKKKALIDPLTGAYSRQYLNVLLEKNKTDRRKHLKTCTLVEIDLDKFKSINDTYGHHVGDKVLIKVVEVLKEMVRDGDYVIRFGGDEFLIILHECKEDSAIIITERILNELKNVEAFDFAIEFSYGVQEISCQKDLYEAIKSADEKMYQAKLRGKKSE